MLPNAAEGSYPVEATISSLYRNCRDIDALDKSQSDLLLKQAIKSVGKLQPPKISMAICHGNEPFY